MKLRDLGIFLMAGVSLGSLVIDSYMSFESGEPFDKAAKEFAQRDGNDTEALLKADLKSDHIRQILLQERMLKEEWTNRDRHLIPAERMWMKEEYMRQQSLPPEERGILSYEQMRVTYFKIWEKAGCPTLATKDTGSVTAMLASYLPKEKGRDRALFVQNAGGLREIYNPGETYGEQIAELAHAYSHANGFSCDKVPWGCSKEDEYYTVNLREFNDHGCVEPVIDAVLRNRIPFKKMDTEIQRRLDTVKKLSECGITYLRIQKSDIIHNVSNLLTEMGYFGTDAKPIQNVSAFYEGQEDSIGWVREHDGSLVSDTELVIHWVHAFQKRTDKTADDFFEGLKKIKETVNIISKDRKMCAIAKQNNVKASDIAALAEKDTLTRETLSHYFSSVKAPRAEKNVSLKTGLKEHLKMASLTKTDPAVSAKLIETVQRRQRNGRG